MTYKSWAAAGASCLAIAALAAASANQATASSNRYAGAITLGYSFSQLDTQTGGDNIDFNTFIGTGSVMYNVEGNWFAQGNFAFDSSSPDVPGISAVNFSIDSWTAGGSFFWRDPSQGMIGVDLGYQSVDVAIKGDGIRAGVRGEWYPSDRWTVSGAVGWEEADFSLISIDGIYANAAIKFYFNDRTSINLNANYYEADLSNSIPFDTTQWSVGLEGEYLISRETPVSVYAGARYGEFNIDNNPFNDPTQWTAYVGLKFRFGNSGDPLVGQDREGTVPVTTTGFVTPFQM